MGDERSSGRDAGRGAAGGAVGDVARRPAPGRVTRTQRLPARAVVQRKAAGSSELTDDATRLMAPPPATVPLVRALVDLEGAALDARTLWQRVRAGQVAARVATPAMAAIVTAALPHVIALTGARASVEVARRAVRGPGLAERVAGAAALARRRDVADAVTDFAPRVHHALDELWRWAGGLADGLAGLGDPSDSPDGRALAVLRRQIAALAGVGTSLGWVAPGSLAEADARRRARDACPLGDDEPGPGCRLSDAERVDRRHLTLRELDRVLADLVAACAARRAGLAAAVARHAATGGLVLGVALDAIQLGIGAATGGVSPLASVGLGLGKAWARGALQLDRYLESDTIDMLDALAGAARAVHDGVADALPALADRELGLVHAGLTRVTAGVLAARLAALVTDYRQQIEPIGHTVGDGLTHMRHPTARHRAIWIEWLTVRRLALVIHESLPDRRLAALPGERRPADAYRFVRWIDPRFRDLLDEPLPSVDALDVAGVPVDELAAGSRP